MLLIFYQVIWQTLGELIASMKLHTSYMESLLTVENDEMMPPDGNDPSQHHCSAAGVRCQTKLLPAPNWHHQ